MNCPMCHSADIQSNKIDEATMEKVAHATQAARSLKHPGFTFLGIGVWGGMQAINAFRKDWRCNVCGHRF